MSEEFNLSKKVVNLPNGYVAVLIDDVSEFIRRLKEMCPALRMEPYKSELEKLAGQKLSENHTQKEQGK